MNHESGRDPRIALFAALACLVLLSCDADTHLVLEVQAWEHSQYSGWYVLVSAPYDTVRVSGFTPERWDFRIPQHAYDGLIAAFHREEANKEITATIYDGDAYSGDTLARGTTSGEADWVRVEWRTH